LPRSHEVSAPRLVIREAVSEGLLDKEDVSVAAGAAPDAADAAETAVRDYLQQNEKSWPQTGLNSWQAACYGALAASDWFCAGDFRF
jgi:hypothetical protein